MTLPRIFREVSGVTVRLMSDKELARLEVLRDLDQRRLRPTAAAQLLGLERRQIFSAFEGLSDRGPGRLDLEAGWSSEQPAPARRASNHGAGDHSRALLGFRPNLSGGEAGRVARDCSRSGDTAPMDDGGWAVGRPQAAPETRSPAPFAARVCRRAGSD